MRPWKRITIDALGEVIPCEFEYKDLHSFGNINNETPVMSVWRSASSREFRKRFNLGNNEYYLCENCTFKNRVADDCIVEKIVLDRKSPQNCVPSGG
jgi:radical SAM protein with 4Fe4S-binding SPASM domain